MSRASFWPIGTQSCHAFQFIMANSWLKNRAEKDRSTGYIRVAKSFVRFAGPHSVIPACAGMTGEVGAGLKPAPTAGLVVVKCALILATDITETPPSPNCLNSKTPAYYDIGIASLWRCCFSGREDSRWEIFS